MSKQDLITLWGSKTRTITWIEPQSYKALGDVIAVAEPDRFRLTDLTDAGVKHDYDALAAVVLETWQQIRAGKDLAWMATHELDPEKGYQAYRPIVRDKPLDGQTDALDMLEEK